MHDRQQTVAYPIFVIVALCIWWLASEAHEELPNFLLLLFLASGGLFLSISSFLLGGGGAKSDRFSLIHALSATFMRLLIFCPIMLATIGRASEVRSLKLPEISLLQGVWPHDWGLFASPWSFILALSYLLALLPICGRRPPLEAHTGNNDLGVLMARISEWCGQLILMGLWLSLFGGHSWNHGASMIAGLIIVTKLALLSQLVGWFRSRSGSVRQGESWSLFGGSNLIISFLAAFMSLGFSVSRLDENNAELMSVFSLALGGASLLFLFVVVQRSWVHMGRRIDPWI